MGAKRPIRRGLHTVRYNTNSPCPWETCSPDGKMQLGFETKAEAEEFARELDARAAKASEPKTVPCEHGGCTERITVDPQHQCIACKGHYCLTHLKNATWYGGDPANLCFDCEKDQAEPVQF